MSTTDFDLGDLFGSSPTPYDDDDRPGRTEDRVPRDKHGKPRILPPGESEMPTSESARDRILRSYGRPSSFAEVVDDHYNLDRWRERRIVGGLMKERRLQLEYAGLGDVEADYDSKREANRVIRKMINADRADEKADEGTGVHTLTERLDLGLEIKFIPGDFEGNIADWKRLTKDLIVRTPQHDVECFVVEDHYRLAGTFDRLFWYHVPCPTCGAHLRVGDLKGLALNTPLPTPTGWTTMGDVREGDQVTGKDGRPARVTAKSSTKRIGTYVVVFDDGSQVICDSEHLWETTTGQGRSAITSVKDIVTIRETLRTARGQADHRVAMPQPMELPDADLPIEPYLLGTWLGDGAARGGTITKGRDLFAILESDGHSLAVEQKNHSDQVFTRTVHGLTGGLRAAGLVRNKHIPATYLRASYSQRLRLVQGLMDTDGSWNTARQTATFSTTDERLAGQVEELLLTLGQRPYRASYTARGFGKVLTAWKVEFTPVDLNPFRLPRKADQAAASTKSTNNSRRRVIISVEPGPDVETACIAVDSPDHMYLAGERMVPTHNTGKTTWGGLKMAAQVGIYAHGKRYNPVTGERTPLGLNYETGEVDPVCTCRGIIVDIPSGQPEGSGRLRWINIAQGWNLAVRLAHEIRAARRLDNWWLDFETIPDIMPLIEAATSRTELNALYAQHRAVWRDEHTNMAGTVIESKGLK